MRLKLFYISIVIVLISCKEEKQPEIISFDELAGIEQDDTSGNLSVTNDTAQLKTPIEIFTKSQLNQFDTFPHKVIHTLDRFGFNKSIKREFIAKNTTSYQTGQNQTNKATLYYYSFSDSLKTKNAFYNWLDCFGEGCSEVKLNEDITSLKTLPMLALMYDTVIVAIEYKCDDKKFDWKSFEKSLVSELGNDFNHCINVACNGPLKWKH